MQIRTISGLNLWVHTIGTLTGPWHVASGPDPRPRSHYKIGWYIVNVDTRAQVYIGPVKGKGLNYHDRAVDIAKARNSKPVKGIAQQ